MTFCIRFADQQQQATDCKLLHASCNGNCCSLRLRCRRTNSMWQRGRNWTSYERLNRDTCFQTNSDQQQEPLRRWRRRSNMEFGHLLLCACVCVLYRHVNSSWFNINDDHDQNNKNNFRWQANKLNEWTRRANSMMAKWALEAYEALGG